jgi:hypothetical protein
MVRFDEKSALPLEARTLRHHTHLWTDFHGQCTLISGGGNSFLVQQAGEIARVSRHFEDKLNVPLGDVIDFLAIRYPRVHILGTDSGKLEDDSISGRAVKETKVYQTPLSVDEYLFKLKKFFGCGYEFRRLQPSDIDAMIRLQDSWLKTKVGLVNSALVKAFAYRKKGKEGLAEYAKIVDLAAEEVGLLDICFKEGDKYAEVFQQGLTEVFGAFHNGNLVACCTLQGNDDYILFSDRHGIRMQKSPQEFLDLNIALMLAQRGVKIFDRGFVNNRLGSQSLLDYKRKFGPLDIREEVSFYDAMSSR